MKLSFEEIKNIAGTPIDHSFLRYKKELESYGYKVSKISMKEETITLKKQQNKNINTEYLRKYKLLIENPMFSN